MDEEPDLDDDGADEPPGPAEPPTVFGFAASPPGCGLLAALGFALLIAPLLLIDAAVTICDWSDPSCMPGTVRRDPAVLAVLGLLGLLFGLATALMLRWRLAAMRAGGSARPPLWAAFVALTWLALSVAGMLGPAALALLAD